MPDARPSGLAMSLLVGAILVLAILGAAFLLPLVDCPNCEVELSYGTGPFPGCPLCRGSYRVSVFRRWEFHQGRRSH
jgi:hypothetical protein